MGKKLMASAAVLFATSLAISGCSTPTKKDPAATSSSDGAGAGAGAASGELTVLWNQYFYGWNTATGFGNNVTNANVKYVTSSGYWYYDKDLQKVKDPSFGSYEKTSDSPMTIKQTIADTATWSDGQPVKACDLILAYGASSSLYNTVKADDVVNDDGTVKKSDEVYFDSSSEAWKLITDFPQVAEDGKSVTYTYSTPYADWEFALFGAGMPAHIVGKRALGVSDPAAACDAVTKAFQEKDKASLSKIANVWNSDWNFTATPDADLLVANGPYVIKSIADKKSLTLTANPEYKGANKPKIKDVTIVYNEDPTAAGQALQNGEVAVIQPQATPDLLKTLQGDSKLEVLTGDQASYEHIDLVFDNGGPFDPKTYGGDATKALKVRQAFLKTIPRQKIVDNLVKPLNPNAVIRQSFNMTPGTTNYEPTTAGNTVEATYKDVDVAGAKALLTEAGVTGTVNVRFMYAKTNPRRQAEYRLVAESAKAAGFNVVDGGDEKWSSKLGGGTYDAALFAWSSSDDSLSGSASNFVTGGQNNYGHYSNKQVDDWYAQLKQEADPAKQVELNTQIEKQLTADAFGLPVFQFPDVTAFDKTKVKNVSTIPFNPSYYWNIWQWELV